MPTCADTSFLVRGVLYRDISILVYAYILMDCFKNHGLRIMDLRIMGFLNEGRLSVGTTRLRLGLRRGKRQGLHFEDLRRSFFAAGVLYRDISILVYAYILMDCFNACGFGWFVA